MKVLHLRNDALLGRYPHKHVKKLFAEYQIDYLFEEDIDKGLWKDGERLALYCNQQNIKWIFWNWEKLDSKIYKSLFEAQRDFKIVLFGHEQPQALSNLRKNQHYADYAITSSIIYKNEVNGFLPFGIHTYYFKDEKISYNDKQKRILISGSYRHSRGQLFEWLLREQPFDWPVYLYPPDLSTNHVEKDLMRQIVARYPKYVYPAATTNYGYISELLSHLNTHRFFIDFTTNSTNYLKFHEDFQTIMTQSKDLPGGYCPERMLDALWLGTLSWCLYDKAIINLVGDAVNYYSSLDELVTSVNQKIRTGQQREESNTVSTIAQRYTTEQIIKRLAFFFKTELLHGF